MGRTKSPSEQGLHVPKDMKDAAALALAFLAVAVLVQVVASQLDRMPFIHEEIRKYLTAACFAIIPPVFVVFKRVFKQSSGTATAPESSLPWFVTGAVAGVLLFAWNQLISLLGAAAVLSTVSRITDLSPAGEELPVDALAAGVVLIATPLTVLAAIAAGVLVNRRTRRAPFAAVSIGAAVFLGLTVLSTWLLGGATFLARIDAAGAHGAAELIGAWVGMVMTPLLIVAGGGLGLLISSLMKDRDLTRLARKARALEPAQLQRAIAAFGNDTRRTRRK